MFLIPSFAQTPKGEDSIHIAKLKESLITAKGTTKIEILNDLAGEYAAFKRQKDSTIKYQKWAYNEAQKFPDYKHGLALALLRLPGTEDEQKSNAQKGFQIANETNDYEVLGWYYYSGKTGRTKAEESIEDFKKSVGYFKKGGFVEDEAEVSTWLTLMLVYSGKYEEAFAYAERNLTIAKIKRTHNISLQHTLIEHSYTNVSELYKAAGDYETAIAYLHRARNYNLQHIVAWTMNPMLAHLYNNINKPDSAIFYLQPDKKTPVVLLGLGESYFTKKDYQTARKYIDEAIDTLTLPRVKPFYWNNDPYLMGAYHLKTKVYKGMGDYQSALQFLRKSDKHATISNGGVEEQLDKWKLYSDIYHNLGNNDSAFAYLNKYTVLKDSIDNKKNIWRLNLQLNNMKASVIETQNKTDLAIKESKLKQQVFIRNSLIGGLVLLFLIGVFAFRNLHLKRKNERLRLQKDLELQKMQSEQKQTEFQRQAIELEMQALRAQMNPHFIFNCLSSINRFIFKNDNKEASDYLTKFSRLIRMVLIQSQKKLIPLEDELEMLRLYLDMERMRFKNGFDYSITTNNTIDAGAIFIPPLLLQPFCENAIWHGLMHKDGHGHLNISIAEENKFLICTITDDGVGRTKAETYKSKSAEKEKSLGLKITANRLALLNREQNIGTSYAIVDILNEEGNVAGTKVQLKIFYKEALEEIEQNA
jgi:hypothetical protein